MKPVSIVYQFPTLGPHSEYRMVTACHVVPTQNIVHVTFMFLAIIIDLHVLHSMHVIMSMYMHVS